MSCTCTQQLVWPPKGVKVDGGIGKIVAVYIYIEFINRITLQTSTSAPTSGSPWPIKTMQVVPPASVLAEASIPEPG